MNEAIASRVLSMGLQTWGQSQAERDQAWSEAFDVLNLKARMATGEVIGDDWEIAEQFVTAVRRQFPMGKFEREVAMIQAEMVNVAALREASR